MSSILATWNEDIRVREAYKDEEGYWIELELGWCFESGSHSITSPLLKNVLAAFEKIAQCNCTTCAVKVPQAVELTPASQRVALLKPCYCGEADEFQIEVYERGVEDRLTAKFVDVTFHMTQEAANAAAFEINGSDEIVLHKDVDAPCAVSNASNSADLTDANASEGDEMGRKLKYKGPIEIPSVQALLKRITKRTEKNPLKAKELNGQYQNRVARRLASAGLVASEKREGVGLVFFGKPVKA